MATAPLVTLRGIPSIPKLGDDGGDDDPTKVDRTPPPPPAPVRTARRAAPLSSVPPPRESDVRALAPKRDVGAKRPVPRPATRPTSSSPPPLNVRAPMSSCPTEPIDASCIEEVLAAVDRPRAQAAPPPLPSIRPPAPSVDVAALFDARPRALVLLLTVAWFVRYTAVASFHKSVVLFAEAKVGAREAWTAATARARQR